jgi:hypothetical protein
MTDAAPEANQKVFVLLSAIPQPWRAIVEDLSSRNKNLDAEVERLQIALGTTQRSADEWSENFRALEKAVVGDTGLSAITVALQARKYKPRAEALEAERDRLQIEKKDLIAAVQVGANAHSKVEDDLTCLRTAAQALRDDMLERSRAGMDVIHGEQYQIVNAGNTAWYNFCEALDAVTPPSSGESKS